MASLDDLAELIARHREAAARMFDSEIEKLRHVYGQAIVTKALELASRQGDRSISIAASRERHRTQRAAERWTQRHFRDQHGDEPSTQGTSLASWTPGWRR